MIRQRSPSPLEAPQDLYSQRATLFDWMTAIRESVSHGDIDRHVAFTLLMLATWIFDPLYDAGPTQAQIGQGTNQATRTVRRHMIRAEQEGWVARLAGGDHGQNWRLTRYVPMVPAGACRDGDAALQSRKTPVRESEEG